MDSVNMLEAKTHLSRLVDDVASGRVAEVLIARHGRPAARLVPIALVAAGPRIGVAKGLFDVPDDIDADNGEIARLFSIGFEP